MASLSVPALLTAHFYCLCTIPIAAMHAQRQLLASTFTS